jgi:hypothetical protein
VSSTYEMSHNSAIFTYQTIVATIPAFASSGPIARFQPLNTLQMG